VTIRSTRDLSNAPLIFVAGLQLRRANDYLRRHGSLVERKTWKIVDGNEYRRCGGGRESGSAPPSFCTSSRALLLRGCFVGARRLQGAMKTARAEKENERDQWVDATGSDSERRQIKYRLNGNCREHCVTLTPQMYKGCGSMTHSFPAMHFRVHAV
jgi:hypothetical protein